MSIKVNKLLLKEFFSTPKPKITKEQLAELDKIFNIIIAKYYSKYYYMSEELRDFARVAVLSRHDKYDPSYDAYNYIFTIFRNEVGNRIKSMSREASLESSIEERHNVAVIRTLTSLMESAAELPPEIRRYAGYLSGETPFTMIRVSKKDMVPLMLFIKAHEPINTVIPEFVSKIKSPIKVLYSLLKDIIELSYGSK